MREIYSVPVELFFLVPSMILPRFIQLIIFASHLTSDNKGINSQYIHLVFLYLVFRKGKRIDIFVYLIKTLNCEKYTD